MNQTELKKILNKQAGHNKYGNHKVKCLSKHTHDSKLEANYCNRLYAMRQKGEIIDYDVQVPYDLMVKDILICRHIVDFKLTYHNGEVEVHDTKGMKTDVFIIKHKLFKVLYPDIKYRVIEAH